MRYVSTRGNAPVLSFTEVVTSGLASDGGLYFPEKIPHFSIDEIKSWKGLSYPELAFKVIQPYVDGEIADSELRNIINESYKTFRTPNVVELKELEKNLYVMELFHGPTIAFKDVALQLLGRLQDHVLSKKKEDVVIIGATSGDTGSAAIEGVKNCKHVKLFMMHPHGKVSTIQRHQMTTVISDNIFNIAIDGTFDDCQDAVKEMFRTPEFMKGKKLSAVNSINWARIIAQIVYYFWAVLNLTGAEDPVSFTVPSGNLGDVFAGYMAKKMGLPVDRLIVSTNENDILHRFFSDNDYSKHGVKHTVAPSMDIQVSSNFERLLFVEHGLDGKKINQLMDDFKKTGKLNVAKNIFESISGTFESMPSNDDEIRKEIKRVNDKYDYIVCPHTATGTRAADRLRQEKRKMVVLATASAAKFPDVVVEATGVKPSLPAHLNDLLSRKEKYQELANDIDQIKNYIYQNSIG